MRSRINNLILNKLRNLPIDLYQNIHIQILVMQISVENTVCMETNHMSMIVRHLNDVLLFLPEAHKSLSNIIFNYFYSSGI